MSFRPKLRTVLLLLNLLVLLLPLAGIAILRLYESELVRQTESELISQAALTASMFRQSYLEQFDKLKEKERGADLSRRGNPLAAHNSRDSEEFIPVPPQLDLAAGRIRPPALPGEHPSALPDPVVLAAGQELEPILVDARRVVMSGVRIVDHQGIVVVSSGSEGGLSLAAREEVAKALTGEPASLVRIRNFDSHSPGFASISRRARLRVFVALPVIVENRVMGAVVASRTPLDVPKGLFLMRTHLFKVALVLLLVVLLMASLTAYYINRPVRALIRQAERLKSGAGNGSEPVANPGIQEVAQLSAAIAEMATTLETRSAYIRTFATNVSHEFKTPLTSIHGAVEILKDHLQEMSQSEREKFLAIIDSETGRLELLVRRLLDLARADNFTVTEESCDPTDVLETLAERFRSQGVTVALECATRAPLRMGRETFESVVTNLLENARQHGGDSIRVDIRSRVATETGGRLLDLDIKDDGPGISAGNRDKIFRPFFTTARATGGSGLGLAIVQALLRAHDGAISLEPAERGAHFRIRVPLC